MDYDEVLELIERERGVMYAFRPPFLTKRIESLNDISDNRQNGFLDGLNAIVAESAADRGGSTADRSSSVHQLLDASDTLLKLNRKCGRAISDAQIEQGNIAALYQKRSEDKQRVKDILAAGKRAFANDIDAIEQQAKARKLMGADDEITEQANAVFGDRRGQACEGSDAGKSLKYLEKGVRKMTKGIAFDS